MRKAVLRAVDTAETPELTPKEVQEAWLANYRMEEAALAIAAEARRSRPPLKFKVMESMMLWGMTDKMLAERIIVEQAKQSDAG